MRKFSLLFGSYSLDWDFDAGAHVNVIDCGDVDVVPGDAAESYRLLESRQVSGKLLQSMGRGLRE